MRKLFIITLAVVLLTSVNVFAQAKAKKGEKERAARKSVVVDLGNMLIIGGGVNYRFSDLPYGSMGFGFDFQLGDNVLFSPTIETVQMRVTPGSGYSGATDVEGGEINYIDIGLAIKYFIKESVWVSGGFIYEAFSSGYYSDNIVTSTLFVALDNADESNKLGFQVSTGLYARVKDNVYVIPDFSIRYNLPTESGYSFSSSDIHFGIGFGLGIRL